MSGQGHLSLPAATGGLLPVAAYVRMSTEHQQYSTENQLDRIKEYAAKRQMAIVRVFADEGKSGLSVKGRESLRGMIAEVEAGKADFKGILAYDVSRWGRFQDADESGYYEYICKRAGIGVHLFGGCGGTRHIGSMGRPRRSTGQAALF
jgi:DNA invertase Pin-like site-specific DNA recombinase